MKKERIREFDFVRALCALGIAAFHFCSYVFPELPRPFLTYANGTWGITLSAIFFLVSGAALFYNYPEIRTRGEAWTFWKRRARSVYPMFWIAFLWFYFRSALISHSLFYAGNPLKLIWSFLGIDGYLTLFPSHALSVNYYQVGEWFFGAIIIMYFLYPIILQAFSRKPVLTWIVSAVLYLVSICTGVFGGLALFSGSANLFAFLFLTITGMLLVKAYRYWRHPAVFFPALAVTAVLIAVRIPAENVGWMHLLSISLFIVLANVGYYVMKGRASGAFFGWLGGLSMAIYLLQHKAVYQVFELYTPWLAREVVPLMLLTLLLSVAEAWLLTMAAQKITGGIEGLVRARRERNEALPAEGSLSDTDDVRKG